MNAIWPRSSRPRACGRRGNVFKKRRSLMSPYRIKNSGSSSDRILASRCKRAAYSCFSQFSSALRPRFNLGIASIFPVSAQKTTPMGPVPLAVRFHPPHDCIHWPSLGLICSSSNLFHPASYFWSSHAPFSGEVTDSDTTESSSTEACVKPKRAHNGVPHVRICRHTSVGDGDTGD